MDRIDSYLKYHADSSRAMDIDIQVEAIAFLVRQYSLTREQRLWLSFLFATTYCMATAWYVFRRVPSFDALTPADMERWWKAERQGLLFQTDRAWIRSRNQFCQVVATYRAFVEKFSPRAHSQFEALAAVMSAGKTPQERYERDNALRLQEVASRQAVCRLLRRAHDQGGRENATPPSALRLPPARRLRPQILPEADAEAREWLTA